MTEQSCRSNRAQPLPRLVASVVRRHQADGGPTPVTNENAPLSLVVYVVNLRLVYLYYSRCVYAVSQRLCLSLVLENLRYRTTKFQLYRDTGNKLKVRSAHFGARNFVASCHKMI
jgi:hypothetical protein